MNPKGQSAPMSDIQKTPPESTPVIDMPWVLISNQIQQLNENMNQRFNDERLRMDDRFAAQERSLNDRFAAIDQRLDKIDQRMDQMDQRFDKLEHRLEFRVSTWLAIILAALTLIIGVLLGH
ncbi:MAG: hypothetical protein C7B46_18165, partial [Sulfobacillus benefaciens]